MEYLRIDDPIVLFRFTDGRYMGNAFHRFLLHSVLPVLMVLITLTQPGKRFILWWRCQYIKKRRLLVHSLCDSRLP